MSLVGGFPKTLSRLVKILKHAVALKQHLTTVIKRLAVGEKLDLGKKTIQSHLQVIPRDFLPMLLNGRPYSVARWLALALGLRQKVHQVSEERGLVGCKSRKQRRQLRLVYTIQQAKHIAGQIAHNRIGEQQQPIIPSK